MWGYSRPKQGWILGLLLVVVAFSQSAVAFKEQEFKKCAETSFCSRNRNVPQGTNFNIVPASIVLNTATLTATLLHKALDKHFQLTVTSHSDGFVRVMVDESPGVGRYQVPSDVLVSGWETKKQALAEDSRTQSAITLSTGQTKLVLNFQPFSLAITVKGIPALQINSRNLFNFEHRRAKQVCTRLLPDGGLAEGVGVWLRHMLLPYVTSCPLKWLQENDPTGYWEETWMGHTDSKPKGPEAVSLDMVFPGFQHVYGIPERATSLSLRSTNGGS